MRARAESLFAVADVYSSNLRKLGDEAWDIHASNEFMQKTWAREHGLPPRPERRWEFRMRRKVVPWISRVKDQRWFWDTPGAQIKRHKPDILLNQAMDAIPGSFLRELKPHVGCWSGKHHE